MDGLCYISCLYKVWKWHFIINIKFWQNNLKIQDCNVNILYDMLFMLWQYEQLWFAIDCHIPVWRIRKKVLHRHKSRPTWFSAFLLLFTIWFRCHWYCWWFIHFFALFFVVCYTKKKPHVNAYNISTVFEC